MIELGRRWSAWGYFFSIPQGTLPWQPIFLYFIQTLFSSQWPTCNINFVHSSTTRSTVVSVIHEVDRRRLLLTTPANGHWPSGNGHSPWAFPLRHFPGTRVRRDTIRSASAALYARKLITSPINNAARGIARWATARLCLNVYAVSENKKLSYRRVTARCLLSVVILPITTQQCRKYLYDKSWPNRWYEVGGLVGGSVS